MHDNATANIKEPNQFINVILNKIALAKSFHQRVNYAITSKQVLGCLTLRFYLRKRYDKLYLYTHFKGNLGSVRELHKFIKDIQLLCPFMKIESIKGHYKGLILDLDTELTDILIIYLKLIALISKPQHFTLKIKQLCYSYRNNPDTSKIPVHISIYKSLMDKLECNDLRSLLLNVKRETNN